MWQPSIRWARSCRDVMVTAVSRAGLRRLSMTYSNAPPHTNCGVTQPVSSALVNIRSASVVAGCGGGTLIVTSVGAAWAARRACITALREMPTPPAAVDGIERKEVPLEGEAGVSGAASRGLEADDTLGERVGGVKSTPDLGAGAVVGVDAVRNDKFATLGGMLEAVSMAERFSLRAAACRCTGVAAGTADPPVWGPEAPGPLARFTWQLRHSSSLDLNIFISDAGLTSAVQSEQKTRPQPRQWCRRRVIPNSFAQAVQVSALSSGTQWSRRSCAMVLAL